MCHRRCEADWCSGDRVFNHARIPSRRVTFHVKRWWFIADKKMDAAQGPTPRLWPTDRAL